MPTIKLVAFDLDDTLAPSKSALPQPVAQVLRRLLDKTPVCVISGGRFQQFETQLLNHLHASDTQLRQLHLMPTCGTRYLRYRNGDWHTIYAHDLSENTRAQAIQAIEQAARQLGYWHPHPRGPIIEDRGSQITFSALGQQAHLEDKASWDPDGTKRAKLCEVLAQALPQLQVRAGGSTSVDITEKGIDKAFGMNHLVDSTGISREEMLFIGDRLDEGGNDYPVKAAGFPTRQVTSWQDTVEVVTALLNRELFNGEQ